MWPIRKVSLILSIVSLFLFASPHAHALKCTPGEALSRAKWASFGKIKKVVAIKPFVDQSKVKTKPWLALGLAELLGSYLETGKHLGIQGELIKKFPPATIIPNYTITGSYQQTSKNLQIYIKLFGSGPEAVYQTAFSVSPPASGRLFPEMARVARSILEKTKTSFDKRVFAARAGSTANFTAFQSYIKGLEAMLKFDSDYIDVANIWFKEARKDDIYYQAPYFAQEDLWGYQAMETKIKGGVYTHFLEQLAQVENTRIKFSSRPMPVAPSKPKVTSVKEELKVANRYLLGNSHFLAGEAAIKQGEIKEARKELEKAASYVPEDSVALRALYGVYSELGDQKRANEILGRISTEGMCK